MIGATSTPLRERTERVCVRCPQTITNKQRMNPLCRDCNETLSRSERKLWRS